MGGARWIIAIAVSLAPLAALAQEPAEREAASPHGDLDDDDWQSLAPDVPDEHVPSDRLREVSGEVVSTKHVEVRGAGTENLVVLLAPRRGHDRLVVDLGPADAWRSIDLERGDNLAVEGRLAEVGDRRVLVAQRARAGDGCIVTVDRSAQRAQYERLARQTEIGEARMEG
jgi:hypothetical protein